MAEVSLNLLVHLMCPFAERAALVASYKGLSNIVTQISMANKPEILTNANPLGKVPTLIATREGKAYNIYETVVVTNYLANLPGPKLLPQTEDGNVDSVARSAQLTFLLTRPDALIGKTSGLLKTQTPEQIDGIKQELRQINSLLEGSEFFGKAAYGVDELSLADIFFFTPIERFYASNGVFYEDVTAGENLANLDRWFNHMKSFEWVQAVIQPASRYVNQYNKILSGEHRGLEMPLTFYD